MVIPPSPLGRLSYELYWEKMIKKVKNNKAGHGGNKFMQKNILFA